MESCQSSDVWVLHFMRYYEPSDEEFDSKEEAMHEAEVMIDYNSASPEYIVGPDGTRYDAIDGSVMP